MRLPAIRQLIRGRKGGGAEGAGTVLTIDPAGMQKPWTGDLDGMIARRVIRVLTVSSKDLLFQ